MILAAGRGTRMRPLTDATPKPLLEVAGKPLIVWQLERLVAGGFDELVINHAWLGARIEDALGDGSRFGATIAWSREAVALETAGGIVTAMPLLERTARDEPFAVVSADVYTTFDYAGLAPTMAAVAAGYPHHAAHLVATDNPAWHPHGDLAIVDGRVRRDGAQRLTYANIGVFHPRVFDGLPANQPLRLFPWAFALADAGRMTGASFRGCWENVGTPQQLKSLDDALAHD